MRNDALFITSSTYAARSKDQEGLIENAALLFPDRARYRAEDNFLRRGGHCFDPRLSVFVAQRQRSPVVDHGQVPIRFRREHAGTGLTLWCCAGR